MDAIRHTMRQWNSLFLYDTYKKGADCYISIQASCPPRVFNLTPYDDMATVFLPSRLHLSSQPSGKPTTSAPTLASCGNNPERYVKAMEQHFVGDVAKLYAHVAGLKQSGPQSANLRAAFIDGSEALRNFLGIRNPNGIRKRLSFGSSSPRISTSDAPAGLVMAATHSTQDKRVRQSLARLDEALKAHPPGHQASSREYQHSVGTALGDLMQDLHKLPREALQQKAVEIIGQHLPQLNSEARTHIQSLAHKAMEGQNIGHELKASLQDLIQSKGQSTLGALLTKEESPQPKRTDNRGKASFASTLKNATAPSKNGAANPASRPYVSIKLKTYPDYAGQNKVQVQCTDYARQAAELLIDKNGELDGTHISMMLDQLKADKTMPAEHRRHLMRTLVKLKQGGELAETINSICEDKPLKGGAADVVRGTLNLSPEHELTKEDARKAVVMSLLGYLRQGNVGSCFATAPAICLLDSSQEVVAKDMRELLEANKLTAQRNGVLTEIPLNQHVYHAHEAKVNVALDGTCRISNNGLWSEHFKLQDLPGMRAALDALGIPENERQAAIVAALSKMGLKSPYSSTVHNVECKQIIKHLAYQTKGEADPDKRMDAAFRAFNGKQDVGLLQAWEYTLATSAMMQEHYSVENSPYQVASATFFGKNELHDRPDLQSPSKESGAFIRQLRVDPRFKQQKLRQINQHLFNEIGALFQQRFTPQFDMNVRGSSPLLDGVSIYGGTTLYEKIPADNPSQWMRIDNADTFQEAMARLVKDASERAIAHVDRMPGDQKTRREALRLITDHLVAHIQDKAFIEHAVLQMNPDAASEPFGDANQHKNTPWQIGKGGVPNTLIKQYGSELSFDKNSYLALTTSQHTGANSSVDTTSSSGDNVMHVVNVICVGLNQMAPKLQAKAQESPGGFKIPLVQSSHLFSLMPMEIKELWSDNPVTPEKWADDNLKKPADQWLKEIRTSPPLSDLLKAVSAKIGTTPAQIQAIYQGLHEKSTKSGRLRLNFKEPPYTIHDLHEKLNKYCRSQENGDELLAKAENVLFDKLPNPAKIVADTNWVSPEGRPVYLGLLHNPFTNKLEAKKMHQDSTDRWPLFNGCFDENAQTVIYAPLATKKRISSE